MAVVLFRVLAVLLGLGVMLLLLLVLSAAALVGLVTWVWCRLTGRPWTPFGFTVWQRARQGQGMWAHMHKAQNMWGGAGRSSAKSAQARQAEDVDFREAPASHIHDSARTVDAPVQVRLPGYERRDEV